MPNPIISKSFTPDADGTLICTATYSVQQTGTAADWGATDPRSFMRLSKDSDSSTLADGPDQPCTRTRMSQVYRTSFSCLASNGAQTVSLRATGGGAGTSINYWDIDLTVELIKR